MDAGCGRGGDGSLNERAGDTRRTRAKRASANTAPGAADATGGAPLWGNRTRRATSDPKRTARFNGSRIWTPKAAAPTVRRGLTAIGGECHARGPAPIGPRVPGGAIRRATGSASRGGLPPKLPVPYRIWHGSPDLMSVSHDANGPDL